MKILRIRRGYTTNSSAYTEWLPPAPGQGATGQNAATPAAPGAPVAPAGGPAGSSPAVSAPAPQAAPAQAAGSNAAGNSLVIGGVVAALLGVFVTERVIRRLRRKGEDNGADGDE